MALDALNAGLQKKRVNWILDADIKGFFDHVSHEWLLKFIGHRVADNRVLRLIQKWLKAGVSEDGEWSETTVGTPQGAVASPLLANVYLHYVFDLWAEKWREKVARGDVIIVRYADDLVAGFQHQADAERFLRDFRERLAKFGLEIHPEKTRLIAFGRFAASDCRKRGKGKPETFAFLGFTHYCGRNSKGHFVVWRRTVAKRMRAKLHAIKQELRRKMHEPVAVVGAWLKRVVDGYYRLPCRAGEPGCARAFSRAALPLLAARSTSSKSAAKARLGTTAAHLRSMDSSSTYSSSLSR
jgi:group II intron reverse transcriptase/maturase